MSLTVLMALHEVVLDSREQGWCSGESTRLPPVWPGFDSRTRREFVVGSRPSSEGFSPGSPVFLPSQKPTFSKFQFNLERTDTFERAPGALWCFVGK